MDVQHELTTREQVIHQTNLIIQWEEYVAVTVCCLRG